MKKKLFTVLLSLMIIMCMMPTMAFAEGEADDPQTEPEITSEETAEVSDEIAETEEADVPQAPEAEIPEEQEATEDLQEPSDGAEAVPEDEVSPEEPGDAEKDIQEEVSEEPEADVPDESDEPEDEPVVQEEQNEEQEEEPSVTEEAKVQDPEVIIDETLKPGYTEDTGTDGVIVLYKKGSVFTGKLSEEELQKTSEVAASKSFGRTMSGMLKGGKTEARSTLLSQKRILDKALKSYSIKDTLIFKADQVKTGGPVIKGDTVVSLISSARYSDEELAKILNEQDDILLAEPNLRVHAFGAAGTGTGDPYSKYAYHRNLMNADVIRAAVPEGSEDEIVVAVVDTGVNYEHEELAGTMWVNPGFKDLKGTYGYDFANDDSDPMDDNGHGSHCSGIIAAQAKNDLGTLGVAGDLPNVKIMAVKFLDSEGGGDLMDAISSYCYIARALDDGVNVRIINDSWGAVLPSGLFAKMIDIVGEKGALTFAAAGNDSTDNDQYYSSPANEPSPYMVSVDSLNEDMELASYSSYGRKNTDICTPGSNIISTVSYDNYMPYIYTREQLQKTTAYYGEFDETTVISEEGTITPTVGTDVNGESNEGAVKPLGTSVMKSALTAGSQGTMTLELGEASTVNFDGDSREDSSSRTLNWTIHDPSVGDVYTLFFPYEKEKGIDYLSAYMNICFHTIDDPSSTPYPGLFLAGDAGFTSEDENGNATIDTAAFFMLDQEGVAMLGATDYTYNDIISGSGSFARCSKYVETTFGDNYGIGITYQCASPEDITFCISSLGVAFKDADPADFGQFDLYSGTSMATPAACGAAALLASAYPGGDALDLKAKVLSSVTTSENLEDICSTGGYIDFSDFDINAPKAAILDSSVNFTKKTLTLTGKNLGTVKGTVSYTRPFSGITKDIDPANITWKNDRIVIKNAMDIISTDSTFIVTPKSGKATRSAFYTVKGENLYEKAATTSFWVDSGEDFWFFKNGDKEITKSDLKAYKNGSAKSMFTDIINQYLPSSTSDLTPVQNGEIPYYTAQNGNIYYLDETPVYQEEGEDEGYDDYEDWASASEARPLSKQVSARDAASAPAGDLIPKNDMWEFTDLPVLLAFTDEYQKWTAYEQQMGGDLTPDIQAVTNGVSYNGKIYEQIIFSMSGRDIYALISLDPFAEKQEDMLDVVWDSESAKSGIIPDNIDSHASLAVLSGKLYMIGGIDSSNENSETAVSSKTYVLDPLAKVPVWKNTGADFPNEHASEGIPGGIAGGTALTHNGKIYYVLGLSMADCAYNLTTNDAVYPFNDNVYEFNGKAWKKLPVPLPPAIHAEDGRTASIGINKDGLVFAGLSTDGGGDTFVYKTASGLAADKVIEKLNYTVNGDVYEDLGFGTTTGDHQIFIAPDLDAEEDSETYAVYKLPLSSTGTSNVSYMTSGLGKGTVEGYGIYSKKESVPIKVTPGKNSFIKYIKVDGKKVSGISSKAKTITVTTKNDEHSVEVYFGTYDLSKAKVKLSYTSTTYSGKAKKPTVSVTINGSKLSTSKYTVKYSKNKSIGTATVTVTGKGSYVKSKKATFKIVPKKVTKLTLTPGSKKIKVTYKKLTGGVKYQISYKVKGASSWKKITTSKASYTIKKLKKGKTYQIKVRAFKKVSGKIYYGKWSKVVKTKVK